MTDNKACNIYLKIIRSADQRSSISTHRSRYFTSCWWYKLWFSRFRFYYLRVVRLTSFKSFNPRQYVACLIDYIQNYWVLRILKKFLINIFGFNMTVSSSRPNIKSNLILIVFQEKKMIKFFSILTWWRHCWSCRLYPTTSALSPSPPGSGEAAEPEPGVSKNTNHY